MHQYGVTKVDISIENNVFWTDAFQFGDVDDFTWSFTGQTFAMDLKSQRSDITPVFSLTSGGGTIVVDDATLRVLHFYVADTVIRSSIPNGCYYYDLVMIDSVSGLREPLMYGSVEVGQGVTLED